MRSEAWEEYLTLQKDKAKLKKVNNLLKDIQRNGYNSKSGKNRDA